MLQSSNYNKSGPLTKSYTHARADVRHLGSFGLSDFATRSNKAAKQFHIWNEANVANDLFPMAPYCPSKTNQSCRGALANFALILEHSYWTAFRSPAAPKKIC